MYLSRAYLSKLPKQTVQLNQRRLFATEKIKNAWFGPKLIRLFKYSTGIGVLGGVGYYLATDKERSIDVWGAHERVPQEALYPKRGGAKNLPIITRHIDQSVDNLDDSKPRLVVVGSGWGAISLVKKLQKDKYDVTVVSNNNYFLFTPLLPSATVGTLELR